MPRAAAGFACQVRLFVPVTHPVIIRGQETEVWGKRRRVGRGRRAGGVRGGRGKGGGGGGGRGRGKGKAPVEEAQGQEEGGVSILCLWGGARCSHPDRDRYHLHQRTSKSADPAVQTSILFTNFNAMGKWKVRQ